MNRIRTPTRYITGKPVLTNVLNTYIMNAVNKN